MRHAMGIIPILLALGAVPAVAAPVYYTIDFTLTYSSPLPTSGSFYYDSSTSTFSSFDVTWDGDSFDLTASANTAPFYTTTDPCYSTAANGAQDTFLLLTACSSDASRQYYNGPPMWAGIATAYWTGFFFETNPTLYEQVYGFDYIGSGSSFEAIGGFEASVPEPGTWALTLTGLVLALRKVA